MSTITVTPSDEVENLKARRERVLARADARVSSAEKQQRKLESWEHQDHKNDLKELDDINQQITAAEAKAAPPTLDPEARVRLAKQDPRFAMTPSRRQEKGGEPLIPEKFSRDYFRAFYDGYIGSSGGPLNASLYEGASTSGGYAVPIEVAGQVVPLAPQDCAVRQRALVIPTRSDLKVNQAVTRGAFAAKTETSGFATSQPSLSQFTLSAFAAGAETEISLELAQDADYFKTFVLGDMETALLEYEEPLFISGTGNSQPQGLLGNVGAGVVAEPDTNSNLVSIAATLSVLGTLKATYHKNASWIMQRATSLIIRAAQVGTNLYEPVFRRENGVDLLHGYPCDYSVSMPTAARGATSVLFGDFKRGYLIGDRGGSAMIVKVIQQDAVLAQQGMIVLLGYRRTDGRVMCSQAIQGITTSAS
jgi:HK97 family phage major capsid protein